MDDLEDINPDDIGVKLTSYIIQNANYSSFTKLMLATITTNSGQLTLSQRSLNDTRWYAWNLVSDTSDATDLIQEYTIVTSNFIIYADGSGGYAVRDIYQRSDGDNPTIYMNSSDTLVLSLNNIEYTIDSLDINNIIDSTITDTYAPQFFASSDGFEYLKICCGIGQSTTACSGMCGLVGYFVQYNMPSAACDAIFEENCDSTSNGATSNGTTSNGTTSNDETDPDWSSVCACYNEPGDPIYQTYKNSDLNISNICFNPNCRDPSKSYIKSSDRYASCPDFCTGIIKQTTDEYGILNSDSTISLDCGGASVVAENLTGIKSNSNLSKKLSNKKSKTRKSKTRKSLSGGPSPSPSPSPTPTPSTKSNNITHQGWFIIIIGILIISILFCLIIYLFSRK